MRCVFTRQFNFLPCVVCCPEYCPSVRQTECVQHIGSQTQLGSGAPMVSVNGEQKRNAHELSVSELKHILDNISLIQKRQKKN